MRLRPPDENAPKHDLERSGLSVESGSFWVESGSFWVKFVRSLKKRGLAGVRGASSDQHEGLKTVIGHILERLEPVAPKVCRFLEGAEEDLTAFYAPTTTSLERYTTSHDLTPGRTTGSVRHG